MISNGILILFRVDLQYNGGGGLAESGNATVLKTDDTRNRAGVQIPHPPHVRLRSSNW